MSNKSQIGTLSVFISHSSKDKKAYALPLASLLGKFGLDAWLDQWKIRAGDSIQQKIFQAIKISNAVVLILTSNSLRSKWVRKELELANIKKLQKGNKILPIIIGKIKIPFELQDTAYIRCMSVTPNIAFQIVRGLLKNEHEDWEKAKDYVLIDVITNIEKYESNLKDHDGRSIIMHYKFKRKVMNTIQEVLGKDHAVFYKTIIYDENENIVNGREGSFTYAKSILNELVLCGALELMAGEMGTSYSVSPNYTSIVKSNWKLWLKSRGIG